MEVWLKENYLMKKEISFISRSRQGEKVLMLIVPFYKLLSNKFFENKV